jgi:hypothetical protein
MRIKCWGKTCEKRPLGRRHGCDIVIAMDLQVVGWGVVDWIDLAEGWNDW